MVRGSEVIGQIALTDYLRQDARATVKTASVSRKQVHICTGADETTAELYAQLLGISNNHICANAVGVAATDKEVSKESYIQQLQRKGRKVAMVGDAANDLTAIACADLGIAVKSDIGDKLTEHYAGVVLQRGLLFPIAAAFDVASKTKQNIFQNLFVSLTYNSVITLVAAGLFISLGFTLNPALGVALMVVESAIVFANLYRLKYQKTVCLGSNIENNRESDPTQETTSQILNGLSFSPETSPEHKALPMENPVETSFGSGPITGSSVQFFSGPKKTSQMAGHFQSSGACPGCS